MPEENVSVRGKIISIPINCYGYDIFDISKIQLVVYYHAAFWLVELLLGYMLWPTDSEKRLQFGRQKMIKV